jgi:hypothetical protein
LLGSRTGLDAFGEEKIFSYLPEIKTTISRLPNPQDNQHTCWAIPPNTLAE